MKKNCEKMKKNCEKNQKKFVKFFLNNFVIFFFLCVKNIFP